MHIFFFKMSLFKKIKSKNVLQIRSSLINEDVKSTTKISHHSSACISRNCLNFSTNWDYYLSARESCSDLYTRSLRCPIKRNPKNSGPENGSNICGFKRNKVSIKWIWCNRSVTCQMVCKVVPSCWNQISFGLIPLLVKLRRHFLFKILR